MIGLNELHKWLYEKYVVSKRMRDAKCGFIKKSTRCVSLSDDEKKTISAFWKKVGICPPPQWVKWYGFYKAINANRCPIEWYLPDNFYYAYVDAFFSDTKASSIIDNKNMYDLYFSDVTMPKTIFRKMNGLCLNDHYQLVSFEEVRTLLKEEKQVVVKSALQACGGHGVQFFDLRNEGMEDVMQYIASNDDVIVQECVSQSDFLSSIHKNSINTVRIMSLVYCGEVKIISSVLRIGVNGAKVDNASSGGIVCGINKEGRLKGVAYDTSGNIYKRHPQGAEFAGLIPGYQLCVEEAIRLAPRFVDASKIISWDFSIDKNGFPVLIEANLNAGQVDFHQMCNGPIFGEDTPAILSYVIRHNIMLKKLPFG